VTQAVLLPLLRRWLLRPLPSLLQQHLHVLSWLLQDLDVCGGLGNWHLVNLGALLPVPNLKAWAVVVSLKDGPVG
jgi:hypothetical protein